MGEGVARGGRVLDGLGCVGSGRGWLLGPRWAPILSPPIPPHHLPRCSTPASYPLCCPSPLCHPHTHSSSSSSSTLHPLCPLRCCAGAGGQRGPAEAEGCAARWGQGGRAAWLQVRRPAAGAGAADPVLTPATVLVSSCTELEVELGDCGPMLFLCALALPHSLSALLSSLPPTTPVPQVGLAACDLAVPHVLTHPPWIPQLLWCRYLKVELGDCGHFASLPLADVCSFPPSLPPSLPPFLPGTSRLSWATTTWWCAARWMRPSRLETPRSSSPSMHSTSSTPRWADWEQVEWQPGAGWGDGSRGERGRAGGRTQPSAAQPDALWHPHRCPPHPTHLRPSACPHPPSPCAVERCGLAAEAGEPARRSAGHGAEEQRQQDRQVDRGGAGRVGAPACRLPACLPATLPCRARGWCSAAAGW